MIHDVDDCLRALAERDALNGSRVEIAFDAPTREWSARQNAPTVSMYLYDIREDLQRREVAWEPVRGSDGIVTEHRSPARRFRLSYMITCWTQRPEDEHRLLSAMLGCFLRHPYVPPELLVGSLKESSAPVLMTIALPPPPDRSLADVWSALGGELKPSLDLVVTAAMDATIRIPAALPVREGPIMRIAGPGGATNGAGGPGASGSAGSGPGAGRGSAEGSGPASSGAAGRGSEPGSGPGSSARPGSRRPLSPSDAALLEEVRTSLRVPQQPGEADAAGTGATTELQPGAAEESGSGKGRRKRASTKHGAADDAAGAARPASPDQTGGPAGSAAIPGAYVPVGMPPGRRLIIRSIRRP